MNTVYSIGAITMDVTSFSDTLPLPGQTILGTDFTLIPGGKGANQAVAAARAGAQTAMIGCIGDDVFGAMAYDNLVSEGVATDNVSRKAGQRTGVAHIRVDASAENDIVIVPLANFELTARDVTAALAGSAKGGDVVVAQLEVPIDAIVAGAAAAKELGLLMILDPAPASTQLPESIWDGLFAVTPNETEAEVLTGVKVTDVDSAVAAGQWFLKRGVQNAIVTLAGAGAVVVNQDGFSVAKPFQVKAIDTTAAGDAFTGALAARLASGSEFGASIDYAMAAGALAVTKMGASSSLPKAADIAELLATRED